MMKQYKIVKYTQIGGTWYELREQADGERYLHKLSAPPQ